jgi:hypothetical protein
MDRRGMFASRLSSNPKCIACLLRPLEVVLIGKSTVNNPFLGLGHPVGLSLTSLRGSKRGDPKAKGHNPLDPWRP